MRPPTKSAKPAISKNTLPELLKEQHRWNRIYADQAANQAVVGFRKLAREKATKKNRA